MATPRLLVIFALATLVVAGAFGGLAAIGGWWILPVALTIHLIGSIAVIAAISKRVKPGEDKPDPVTEARLEEERAEEQRAQKEDRAHAGEKDDEPKFGI